jgi:hypothetical protein
MKCGVIPTHYKYICILTLTTVNMATLVAETHRLSLYSKIKFKQPGAFISIDKVYTPY